MKKLRCSIKIRELPDAPPPTRATYQRKVVGNLASELQVIDVAPLPEPAVSLEMQDFPIGPKKDPSAHRKKNIAKAIYARRKSREACKSKAIELYKKGMGVKEICEATGRSRAVVYSYLKEYRGLTRAPKHVYDERAAKLYREGRTYAEIGEELGIPAANVSQVLTRMRKEGLVGRRRM